MSTIRNMISSLDEAAWVALGSKGLLRRANKDLAKGVPVAVLEESEQRLRLSVSDFEVIFTAAGPAQASCTCPARGVCQHILTSGMSLDAGNNLEGQSETAEPSAEINQPETAPSSIPADLTVAALKQWAKAVPFRQAMQLAETPNAVQITSRNPLVAEVPAFRVQVHVIPGGGLDGAICTGTTHNNKPKFIAAAILASWKTSDGLASEIAGELQEAGEETEAKALSAETLEPLLIRTERLVEEAFSIGLMHLSQSFQNRLTTLGITAVGSRLPRLARSVQAAADQLGEIIQRTAQGDPERLYRTLVEIFALCQAIRHAEGAIPVDLTGQVRSKYQEGLVELELFGVGAQAWRSDSGFQGVTGYFWEPHEQEFLTWTDARPETSMAGFKPTALYTTTSMWGAAPPSTLCRSRVKLGEYQFNDRGRLSGSEKTDVRDFASYEPTAEMFGERWVTEWSQLTDRLQKLVAPGLRRAPAATGYVFLQPHEFGDCHFDPTEQVLTWPMYDKDGQAINIVVPFTEWTSAAIDSLENLRPGTGETQKFALFGMLSTTGGVHFRPMSVVRLAQGKKRAVVHCLNLDPPDPDAEPHPGANDLNSWERYKQERAKQVKNALKHKLGSRLARWLAPVLDEFGEACSGSHADEETLADPLAQYLDACHTTLQHLAESGLRAGTTLHAQALEQHVHRAKQFGLSLLAVSLRELSQACAERASVAERFAAFAKLSYLARVHAMALSAGVSLRAMADG